MRHIVLTISAASAPPCAMPDDGEEDLAAAASRGGAIESNMEPPRASNARRSQAICENRRVGGYPGSRRARGALAAFGLGPPLYAPASANSGTLVRHVTAALAVFCVTYLVLATACSRARARSARRALVRRGRDGRDRRHGPRRRARRRRSPRHDAAARRADHRRVPDRGAVLPARRVPRAHPDGLGAHAPVGADLAGRRAVGAPRQRHRVRRAHADRRRGRRRGAAARAAVPARARDRVEPRRRRQLPRQPAEHARRARRAGTPELRALLRAHAAGRRGVPRRERGAARLAVPRSELPTGPLGDRTPPRPAIDRRSPRRALAALALFAGLALAGVELAGAAITAAALHGRRARIPPKRALAAVDWPLLLFFSACSSSCRGSRRPARCRTPTTRSRR